ncbi:MAG: NADH-quinone oxidoreductase subunit A [Armatimonadota bacterium]
MNAPTIWPFAVYGGLVLLVVTGMVALSHFLGERHRSRACDQPYESGIDPTGSARLRYGARYYLVGIFFILFDVEAAVIFAWAVAFREVGWAGYIEAMLFIVTLAAGLLYVWRLGGLDWYSHRRNENQRREP